jgi:glycosyltransferase involved in cell wall biosynthesis
VNSGEANRPNPRLKIGIVTHNYPPHPGGLEIIVQEQVRAFARHHEVVVVTTAWHDRRGVAYEDGATIVRLPAWHGTERRGVPYAVPWGPLTPLAFRELRRCDVLHAHGSLYATTALGLAARRRHAPVFVTEHVGFVTYPSALVNAVQRLAWRGIGHPVIGTAAKVIAYNSRVRDWLIQSLGAGAVAFIPNGVDQGVFAPSTNERRVSARRTLGIGPHEVVGLFAGRETPKKNLDAVLGFDRSAYRLAVCGARRALPETVRDLGVVPHERMPDVFASADFLLHAATGEGFPVVVQEAMASGLPVALLWDAGYDDVVRRDAVVAAHSLADLQDAAIELAGSPELRNAVGGRARAFVEEHWSWPANAQQHLDLFFAALRHHESPGPGDAGPGDRR